MIAALVNWPESIHIIGNSLKGEHFLDPDIGIAFDSLATLAMSGYNIRDTNGLHAVLVELKRKTSLTAHDIAKWAMSYCDYYNARYYASIITTAWKHRQIWKLGIELCERFSVHQAMMPTQEERDDIAYIERRIAAIYETSDIQTVLPIHEVAAQYLSELEEIKDYANGTLTGILDIDQVIGKTMPGELMVIAARPGCGKTALALQVAEHNAGHGTVLFVSLEMRDKELVSRTLCRMAGVDSKLIRNANPNDKDERQYRNDAIQKLKDISKSVYRMPLFIWAPPSATIQQIYGKAKYIKSAHGLRMIIVDYIGIVKVSGEDRRDDRHLQIGVITKTLKEMSKELNVPLIALAQLNRDAQNKKPNIANLRESGSIEQDADIVLMLHHEKNEQGAIEESCIVIGKHRHSDQGEIPIGWNPTLTSFGDISSKPVKKYEEFGEYGN